MYKRWIFILSMMVLFSFACQAVTGIGGVVSGSGEVVSETRPVSGFDQISVCCGMQLIVTQGDVESLEIEADDNLLPEIVSTVSGGRLTIRFKDDQGRTQYWPSQPIRCTVTAIAVRRLEVSGGGSLDAGLIETDDLQIDTSGGSQADVGSVVADTMRVEVSGGGEFYAQDLQVNRLELDLSGGSTGSIDSLEGETLKLDNSGGGEVMVAGRVTEQDVSISGGGKHLAGDLKSETVVISMSGGGQAGLWVEESLDANLSGGARVEYYGRPRITEQVSGGSELVSLGER